MQRHRCKPLLHPSPKWGLTFRLTLTVTGLDYSSGLYRMLGLTVTVTGVVDIGPLSSLLDYIPENIFLTMVSDRVWALARLPILPSRKSRHLDSCSSLVLAIETLPSFLCEKIEKSIVTIAQVMGNSMLSSNSRSRVKTVRYVAPGW